MPGVTLPKSLDATRKRGRPKLTWASVQHARVLELFQGSQTDVNKYFSNKAGAAARWASFVNDVCE